MKAVILAGGAGQRLQEVVKDVPKPMALIAGKPFLEYLVLQLARGKIKEIVLSIGYQAEIIKSYFASGDEWGVQIAYCKEDEPLGTGGALAKAIELVEDEQFIALNGDSFLDLNFSALISFHNQHRAKGTLCLARVNDTGRYGRVEVDKNHEVTAFREKQSGGQGLINGGVYMFRREIFAHFPKGKVSLEREVLPHLMGQGLYGMGAKGFFKDIGRPEDYISLCKNSSALMGVLRL